MHSRIFQISTEPISKDKWITEMDFYEDNSFLGAIADYVDDDTNREEDIQWLLSGFENMPVEYDEEESSIIFLEGFKETYFKERFKQFKKAVNNMTLEDFLDSYEVHKIESLLKDRFGFYVHEDNWTMPLDEFVRRLLIEGQKYYFGSTIDYHF